jgi:hypothetical protein
MRGTTTAEGSIDEVQRAYVGWRGSRASPLHCRMNLGGVTWGKGLRSQLPWPSAGCKGMGWARGGGGCRAPPHKLGA